MSFEERKANMKRVDGEIKIEEINLLRLVKSMYVKFSNSGKEIALNIAKELI